MAMANGMTRLFAATMQMNGIVKLCEAKGLEANGVLLYDATWTMKRRPKTVRLC